MGAIAPIIGAVASLAGSFMSRPSPPSAPSLPPPPPTPIPPAPAPVPAVAAPVAIPAVTPDVAETNAAVSQQQIKRAAVGQQQSVTLLNQYAQNSGTKTLTGQ